MIVYAQRLFQFSVVGLSLSFNELSTYFDHCQTAGNFAPTIEGPFSVLITVGEEFTYSGLVNDSNGDDVTVTTNLAGATVVRAEENFTITATVTNITNFRLAVPAEVHILHHVYTVTVTKRLGKAFGYIRKERAFFSQIII